MVTEVREQQENKRKGDGININRAEILAGIAGYDAKAQEDLTWLHGYAMDQLRGSRSALCEFIGSDWTTIWRVWKGKYEADVAKFVDRVRHYRGKAELHGRTLFVETLITEKIMKVCDVARDQGAAVLISGPTGRSKTWTVQEWKRRNNHGRALYVYAPESGGFRAFLEALARALGLSRHQNNYSLALGIEHSLDYRNVLVIDEVAHLIPSGRSSSLQAIEFIRGLHDRTGCGVVLVATEVFPQVLAGGKWAAWFEQLLGRVELHLKIPDEFGRREVAEICSAYADEPGAGLIKLAREIANARRGGVRELFRHLNRAALAAKAVGEPLSEVHLRAVYDQAQALMTIAKD